jgi:hypothetical protein
MNDEIKTKFIRLVTGEDLIANCFINDETRCVDIESPMKVVITRSTNSGKTILMMMPWLPLEIVSDEYATLKFEDILTIVQPKDSFLEYYKNTIEEYGQMNDDDEDDLFNDMTEEDIHMDEEDEITQVMESLAASKKKLLH